MQRRLLLSTALCALLSATSCGRLAAASSCEPEDDAALCASPEQRCGPNRIHDRCGALRELDCGLCPSGAACSPSGLCLCGESDSALCLRLAKQCGPVDAVDTCGLPRAIDCGACPANGICGGGGTPNVCVSCQSESDVALCERAGAACGSVAATDRCGHDRFANCGQCPTGQTCGAAAANQCGPEMCEDDGFCWVNPLPQGRSLRAVWASSPTEAWAFGADGVILHDTSAGWVKVPSPTHESINAAWGSDVDDIWALGDNGAIVHWDGTAWSAVASSTTLDLIAIWGFGRNEVRACGWHSSGAAVLRWDGRTWSVEVGGASAACHSVWGRSPTDYFLGGKDYLLHWNGSVLEPVANAAGTFLPINYLLGTAANEAWGWGSNGVFHWDGSAWSKVTSPCSHSTPFDLWGTGPNDVWAKCGDGLRRWDGVRWSDAPWPGGSLIAMHGRSSSNLIAVGDNGWMARFDGARWSRLGSTADDSLHDIRTISGTESGDLWMLGMSPSGTVRLLRWDGGGWRKVGPDTLPWAGSDLWVFSPDEIWAGDNHWDGSQWVTTFAAAAAQYHHDQIWGFSPTNVWACGHGSIDHWDGQGWSISALDNSFECADLYGLSPDDVWEMNANNPWHWNGREWVSVEGPFAEGLWGFGSTDLWAVRHDNSGGSIFHWNGALWSLWETTPRALQSVCGRRPDEVWAVGDEIAHWNGQAWSHGTFGLVLRDCWADRSGVVWAAGWPQNILRRAVR